MSWRSAVRLSGVAFQELSLQAIFAFRQGNLPPTGPADRLARKARVRVLQSKAIISAVLALLAVGGAVALRASPRIVASGIVPAGLPPGAFTAGVLTGLLSLDIAFLWWTGLQILPTFLASGVLPVLEPLPIDDRTLRRTAGLLYLRLFDLPAATVLVATPLFVGLAGGLWAGLAIVPGTIAAVVFALALALLTGRFFVRRVQGARGGGGSVVVRWAYLVLWVVPAFSMFAFVTAAPAFFRALTAIATSGPSLAGGLLFATFPFALAALPAVVAEGTAGFSFPDGGLVLLGAAAGYLALAGWAWVWTMGSVRSFGLAPPLVPAPARPARFRLASHGAAYAVLAKDLRIASRTPGYAFLLLLPVLDATVIGLFTLVFASGASAALALALGAVTTAALLATFFGPAFFAIEVNAYAYGRTLPLPDRSIVLGKLALVLALYVVAAGLVLGFTLVKVFAPTVFVAFVAAELPAVAAAGLFEFGVLFRRARRRGLPIVNLYAGAWTALLVSVPGLLLAGAPILLFHELSASSLALGLAGMGGLALVECAACAPIALGRGMR
ncbi:MAG TPA: hypothetical protein VMG81_06340 [Thermoplasmata archaeon]|nr:hypothetical protein [Thermoplasmata archaeon]